MDNQIWSFMLVIRFAFSLLSGTPTNWFIWCKMHSLPPVFREPRSAKIGCLVDKSSGKVGFFQICFVEVAGGMVAEKRTDWHRI